MFRRLLFPVPVAPAPLLPGPVGRSRRRERTANTRTSPFYDSHINIKTSLTHLSFAPQPGVRGDSRPPKASRDSVLGLAQECGVDVVEKKNGNKLTFRSNQRSNLRGRWVVGLGGLGGRCSKYKTFLCEMQYFRLLCELCLLLRKSPTSSPRANKTFR